MLDDTLVKEVKERLKLKDNGLTKEDIVEFGVKMTSYPLSLRDWKELANLVNWTGSSNSLRKFVSRNKSNVVEKETSEYDEIKEATKEFKIEKLKARSEWLAYNRHLREESRVESFKEDLLEAIDKLDKLPNVEYHCTDAIVKNKEAILLLSDLHIGVECDNFYNKYNYEIAKKRVFKLVDDTIKYCKNNNVDILNVVNLGDAVHGIIHTNARVEQQFDVGQQVIYAMELISEAVNKLQAAAPTVVYRSCTDNHSRIIANKDEALEQESFCKIIDWGIKERLKNTNVVFEDDNIDDSIGMFNLKSGKTVMFSHGHLDNINSSYQHMTGATRQFVDYILLGHYHCEKIKSYQGAKIIVNGSVVGTEQYALSKRLFSEPSQLLMIFDNRNLVTISINLNIE